MSHPIYTLTSYLALHPTLLPSPFLPTLAPFALSPLQLPREIKSKIVEVTPPLPS